MSAQPRYVPRAVAAEVEEARRRLPRYGPPPPAVVEDPRVVIAQKFPRGPASAEADLGVGQDVAPSAPTAPVEPSPADLSRKRYLALLQAPVVDENGRLVSGGLRGIDAAGRAAGSGSVGLTLGAGIGGFLGGLLSPKKDEEQRRALDVAKARDVYAAESAVERAERDRREQEADIVNKQKMPVWKDAEQRRLEGEQKRKEEADRAKASDQRKRVLASVFNRVDEFDPDDPANADMVAEMREAGLPVFTKRRGQQVTIKQDAKTGAWYSIAADKGTGEATSKAVTAPDGTAQLQTTSPQAMTSERAQKALESRERVAKWRIAAQKQIAQASQAIQRDGQKLSAEQFKSRYPGAGLSLTPEAIAEKARQLKTDPEIVAAQAVRQGYKIID